MGKFEDFKLEQENVSFSKALEALNDGFVVSRTGWNGKGMFLYKVDAAYYPAATKVANAIYGSGVMVPYEAYIAMKNAQGTINIWAPSQMDMFANDWMILSV